MRRLLVLLRMGVLASSLIEADTLNDDSTLSQAISGFGPLHVKMGSQHPEEQIRDRHKVISNCEEPIAAYCEPCLTLVFQVLWAYTAECPKLCTPGWLRDTCRSKGLGAG